MRPPRLTGRPADALRSAWRRAVGRRLPGLDRAAHRAYFQWERLVFAVRLCSDLRSLVAYLHVESRWAPAGPVAVRARPLGGERVWLRPRTTDPVMLRDTFRDNVHPPPPEIAARGVRRIVDLGANIGLTMADNARAFPGARLLGVELDPGNAEVARRNLAPWGDRCEVLQGAVWITDGSVRYDDTGQEYGFHVVEDGVGAPTRALSMETILSHVPSGERVDYLKMDVEGVESRLLSGAAAGWAARVDSIGLQVHDPYTLEDCARDLAALGFTPRVDRRRVNFIVGVRR